MKMFWFFTATSEIPWAFKYCGMFQAACDSFLGVQYMMYGEGKKEDREYLMEKGQWDGKGAVGGLRAPSRSLTPSRRPAPFNDTEKWEE